MSWICDQVPHCLHISLSRCPTLYMYVFRCPTIYRLYLHTGVPLFTCCVCVQVSHCLHVFRRPTIYRLYLCSGVPLFTRDSGSVLNILSAADLSVVHVPEGRQRRHTTFSNHSGKELWFLHFTLDQGGICVVRKAHTCFTLSLGSFQHVVIDLFQMTACLYMAHKNFYTKCMFKCKHFRK